MIEGGTARGRLACLAIAAALVLTGTALLGCPHEQAAMVSAPPPEGWADRVLEERADKDIRFRNDPDTPLSKEAVETFRGLDYWPPDPAYRFVGPVHVNARAERFTVVTTSGKPRPCERYGWVGFEVRGKRYRLEVFRLLDVAERPGTLPFFVPFLDATTGKESYPAGRYVDLQGPRGGPYVLDFNRAYNPLCAYGSPDRYACPVTPPENRLPFAVETGERGYHRAESAAR